jgi:hypothetical protein
MFLDKAISDGIEVGIWSGFTGSMWEKRGWLHPDAKDMLRRHPVYAANLREEGILKALRSAGLVRRRWWWLEATDAGRAALSPPSDTPEPRYPDPCPECGSGQWLPEMGGTMDLRHYRGCSRWHSYFDGGPNPSDKGGV